LKTNLAGLPISNIVRPIRQLVKPDTPAKRRFLLTTSGKPQDDRIEFNGGVALARQQLLEARKQDPNAQLWPEISMSIVGQDFSREHDVRTAIEVFKLNELAYPDSADVADNLADAYQVDGQMDLARQYARKCIELLNTAGLPASTWANTEQYRGEIRQDAEQVLKSK
jgi:tetratricopeptide (TPR) repeat protein